MKPIDQESKLELPQPKLGTLIPLGFFFGQTLYGKVVGYDSVTGHPIVQLQKEPPSCVNPD